MTDLQLSMLLEQIIERMSTALRDADTRLGSNVERKPGREAKALDPIINLQEDLREWRDRLQGKTPA